VQGSGGSLRVAPVSVAMNRFMRYVDGPARPPFVTLRDEGSLSGSSTALQKARRPAGRCFVPQHDGCWSGSRCKFQSFSYSSFVERKRSFVKAAQQFVPGLQDGCVQGGVTLRETGRGKLVFIANYN
jgi:hypothetical protein